MSDFYDKYDFIPDSIPDAEEDYPVLRTLTRAVLGGLAALLALEVIGLGSEKKK